MANVKISGIGSAATSFEPGDLVEMETAGGVSKKITRTTFSARRGALATLSADITTVNASSGYFVPFNAEDYDTDACHDNSTNNTRHTVTGEWTLIELVASFYATLHADNSAFAIEFYKNGAAFNLTPVFEGEGNAFSEVGAVIVSPRLLATLGDYFEVRFVSGDTSITVKQKATWFEIRLLG